MWSSLALAAAVGLAPAQPAAGLKLTNARFTVGELGPKRDAGRFLPGDILFLGYDIDGITIDPDGRVRYSTGMEVLDGTNRTIFKQDPRALDEFVPLRGGRLPARAFITLGLDQDPGRYTIKLTVTDAKTKAAATLTQPFEVLPRAFGIAAVYPSYDERGLLHAPTVGVIGQQVFVQFSVVDFQRDPKTKQPNVELEFQPTDEKGQPILTPPLKFVQTDSADDKSGAFAVRFPLFMSRPGKFAVKIKATDKTSGKTAAYDLPVTVLPEG